MALYPGGIWEYPERRRRSGVAQGRRNAPCRSPISNQAEFRPMPPGGTMFEVRSASDPWSARSASP
jgi:hypothetical protein